GRCTKSIPPRCFPD
nr:Chain A, GLY-ARG-CYS-THR-LYS-SER-ILE-PRO-PRO-ARG-CYS-PHE-PRO-ASP inhibitor [Helianthus annuus]